MMKLRKSNNEARHRIESLTKLGSSHGKIPLVKLAKMTRENSNKYLYTRKEQVKEQKVFRNMSVHNLKVRWVDESVSNSEFKDLKPIDETRGTQQIID